MGGVASCKLLTTYLVCGTFYNPGDPLYISTCTRARAPHVCVRKGTNTRIRVAVKFDRSIPRAQEGGNFMIAARPIT